MRSPEGWVIDASVAIKWYLRDEDLRRQADSFRSRFSDGDIAAAAPHLSRHEVASALTVACSSGRITADQATTEINAYVRSGVSMDSDPRWLLGNAIEMAIGLRIAYYDAVYVALAESLRMQFVTADRRLYNAVNQRLPFVHWLGDV